MRESGEQSDVSTAAEGKVVVICLLAIAVRLISIS